jgi:polar amino acid transport system substrate-binding protein
MRMLRRAVVVALMLATAIVWSATAATLDEILKAGVIRVGVNPTLPPRALYNDKNEIDGFEPEVARELARKLGVKIELIAVGSPDRIPFVASGKVDFVMGAMSRTSERAKVIDYTVPLHSENYGIVTIEGKNIARLADLNDERITLVQVRGTTAIPYIQQHLPKAKVVLLDNYPDRNRALAQGRGDASFDGIDAVRFALKLFANVKWAIIPTPEYGVTYSGLGVAKGNYSLRDWLNIALYELHVSGFIEKSWEKWFLGPMATKVPASPFF